MRLDEGEGDGIYTVLVSFLQPRINLASLLGEAQRFFLLSRATKPGARVQPVNRPFNVFL